MRQNKEKIKQYILSFIAVLLIFIGYLNYNYDQINDAIEFSSTTNEVNLGDVQLVNSNPVADEGAIVPNDEVESKKEITSNDIETNTIIQSQQLAEEISNVTINNKQNNYFEETRLERERMYSEMIETYQNVISNDQTPSDQKAVAAQEIRNITNIKNQIMVSENLIKNKGFENVVILVNNGNISVVVNAGKLNTEQISRIQNIIQREFCVEVQKINISNK